MNLLFWLIGIPAIVGMHRARSRHWSDNARLAGSTDPSDILAWERPMRRPEPPY
jgi:hypothetical protein